jgi:primosomal protein N' (replication factor Y)
VIVVAPGELRPVQALLRWQPRWHAERELEDRRALHLPPAGRMASLTGTAEAVAELLGSAKLPPAAEILGPVAAIDGEPDDERVLLRVPRVRGQELATALKAAQATRSARKAAGSVRVEMDPIRLG